MVMVMATTPPAALADHSGDASARKDSRPATRGGGGGFPAGRGCERRASSSVSTEVSPAAAAATSAFGVVTSSSGSGLIRGSRSREATSRQRLDAVDGAEPVDPAPGSSSVFGEGETPSATTMATAGPSAAPLAFELAPTARPPPSARPPRGQGQSGSHAFFGGAPDDDRPDADVSGEYGRADKSEFAEFIAFVGWYAFLIFCCLLPTVCAYYRRRRNARALRENFLNIQNRLAAVERRRAEELWRALEGVEGTGGLSLEGDNRDRDWEFIEQLFGSGSNIGEAGQNAAEGDGAVRRRMIMADILGGMSMRALVDRERRRRQERGKRVVAALKETSLAVRECHLIPRVEDAVPGYGDDRGSVGDGLERTARGSDGGDGKSDGNVEIGRIDPEKAEVNIDSKGSDEMKESLPKIGRIDLRNAEGDIGSKESETAEESLTRQNAKTSKPTGSTSDSFSEGAADVIDSSKGFEADNAPPQNPPLNESAQNDATLGADMAVPATVTPKKASAMSSLFAADDAYDDDNTYCALRIPCPGTASGDERLIPATCAICLVPYAPGCYVTWSPNPGCTHCFHRDCILMWLLKKHEPLCPCCRREFVPESILSSAGAGEGEVETDAAGAETILDVGGSSMVPAEATRDPLPQAHPARYSNPPASFAISMGRGVGDGGSGSTLPRPDPPRYSNFPSSFSIGT